MKLFVVQVWLCVSGHVTVDGTLDKQWCEQHEGLEEGMGLASDCLMKAQVLASKYVRSDLVVARIQCKRDQK